MPQQSGTAEVFVTHHLFGILEGDDWDQKDNSGANGLVSPLKRGAYLYTGIHTGAIRVTAAALDGSPGDPVEGRWDEIVDVSIKARRGDLRVRAFEDEAERLPLLSTRGGGWYRCRVHASGRDTLTDGTADSPVEDYLIQVWPHDEQLPQTLHRSTDRYGATLRGK